MKRFLKRILPILLMSIISVILLVYSISNTSDILPDTSESDNTIKNEEKEPPKQSDQTKFGTQKIKEQLANLSLNTAENYILSDEVFENENFVLTLSKSANRAKFPKKAKYEFDLIFDNGVAVPSWDYHLRAHMGYISLSDENSVKILTPAGVEIPVPEEYNLAFVPARDRANNPVFVDKNTWSYFVISAEGTIVPTDYQPERDFRGINFDYPSYFGVSDDPRFEATYSNRGCGYIIDGEQEVPNTYEKTFAYSEGFGCAYDEQNRLYFFNDEGRIRIAGLAEIMYGSGEIADERALGYYYFDEGLTRVTKKQFRKGELISQYETFINRKGDEFKTPADYIVYSYSNGRILLHKNGLGGYMTPRGKWICQPIYSFTRPFFEGLAVVGDADGKKGVIDRDGNFVIQPVFDEITDCSGGIICAFEKETGWHIIHKMKKVLPEEPDMAEIQKDNTENDNSKIN